MLEPYVLKGTRTVLRREGKSNPPDLSDYIPTVHFTLKTVLSRTMENISMEAQYTSMKTLIKIM